MKRVIKWCAVCILCLSCVILCCCENRQQEKPDTEETESAGGKTQGVTEQGTTGDGVTYQYNKLTETLTVSGKIIKGADSVDDIDKIPWRKWCRDAKKLVLEDGVECVTDMAFADFWRLKEVVFPDTLKKIDVYAFYDSLREREINRLKLPDSVEEIGWCALAQKAFYKGPEDKGLKEILLPKKLRSIGECAFASQAMTSITIPENVESIGSCAFEDCLNLEKVIIKSKKIKKASGCFLRVNHKVIKVYVPKDVEKKYREMLEGANAHVYPMKE